MGIIKPPSYAGVENGFLVKPDDPFFTGVSDALADKGFIIAGSEDLVTWARTGSLMWMTFGLACCAVAVSYTHLDVYKRQAFTCKLKD